jgi:hypothetical protein
MGTAINYSLPGEENLQAGYGIWGMCPAVHMSTCYSSFVNAKWQRFMWSCTVDRGTHAPVFIPPHKYHSLESEDSLTMCDCSMKEYLHILEATHSFVCTSVLKQQMHTNKKWLYHILKFTYKFQSLLWPSSRCFMIILVSNKCSIGQLLYYRNAGKI